MERIRQVKEKDYRRASLAVTEAVPETTATTTPPTYTPWSKQDFVERVSTYSYQKYTVDTSLYPKLSPYNVARFGWKCTGSNMLQCVSCGSYLAIVVGDEEDEATAKVVQDKYVGLLTQNHAPSCLWKNKACSESLGSIMGNIGQLRRDLGGKFDDLGNVEVCVDGESVDKFVKTLNQEVESVELKENGENEATTDLTQSVEVPSSTDTSAHSSEVAKIIIAAGWTNSHKMLRCRYCSRIVKPTDSFDVVQEHRDWCPYVVEKEDGKPAWWQVLAKPVKECSKKRLSKVREVYFGV